ncbi:MAG TPA: hypothetical protein VJ872_09670 [Nocardioides sp.]|nr:hypothetical protein [Nocardioides sp.]
MDGDWQPFLAPDSGNIDDFATDAIVLLLQSGGLEQISMSAVARFESVTPSALHHRHGGRGPFLEAVVGRFSARWISWVTGAGFGGELPVRLPETANEVEGVRAWSMIRALAEGELRAGRDGCADFVREARVHERDHVRRWLRSLREGQTPSDDQMQVVMLLADGIRESVADPEGRLGLAQGRKLLTETIGQLLDVRFAEPSSWLDG